MISPAPGMGETTKGSTLLSRHRWTPDPGGRGDERRQRVEALSQSGLLGHFERISRCLIFRRRRQNHPTAATAESHLCVSDCRFYRSSFCPTRMTGSRRESPFGQLRVGHTGTDCTHIYW
jgi:hypothetical protein